ncbi:MAG: aldehyde ferredoxin oxidoreductase N-terminal domain-containing protein [Candidatus Muiribacteriota bacterium]
MKLTKSQILNLFDFLVSKTLYLGSNLDKRVEEAIKYKEDSLELLPFQVDKIDEILKRARLKFSVLLGYPLGIESVQSKKAEILRLQENNIDEFILMPNLAMIKSDNFEYISEEIKSLKEVSKIPLKVVVTSIMLTREEINKLGSITEKNGVILINSYENIKQEKSDKGTKFVKSGNFKNKILKLRLTERVVEEVAQDNFDNIFCGRNLSVNQMLQNRAYEYGAFDALNKIIISPGSFSSLISSSGGTSIAFRSPLTEKLKVIEIMGNFGEKLSSLGIKSIIIDEISKDPVFIYFSNNKVEFIPASDYIQTGTKEMFKRLKNDFGSEIGIIGIGPSGEEKLLCSTLVASNSNGEPDVIPARGGGIGAVLGTKNVKGIIVDKVSEGKTLNKKLNKAFNHFEELLLENTVTGRMLSQFSTLGFLPVVNKLEGLCGNNFRIDKLEVSELNKLNKQIKQNFEFGKKCQSCVIKCFNKNKKTHRNISFIDFASLGIMNKIFDMDDFALLHDWCLDYGVDPLETGGAISIAREAKVIPETFSAEELISLLKKSDWKSRTIFQGGNISMKTFAVSRAPVLNNEVILPYNNENMILMKEAGNYSGGMDEGINYSLAYYLVYGKGEVSKENISDINRNLIYMGALLNTLGICHYAKPAFLKNQKILSGLVNIINEIFDARILPADLLKLSRQVIKNEEKFNIKS